MWWERAEVVEEDKPEIETDTWDVPPVHLTAGEVIDYGGREPDRGLDQIWVRPGLSGVAG